MRWNEFGIVIFLIVLSASFSLGLVQINEIMYDPEQCSDTVCEWVELYNAEGVAVNLTSCVLDGKNLTGSIPAQGYLIVAKNIQNFTQYFGPVDTIVQSSLSLANSGDTIVLNGTGECADAVNYTFYVNKGYTNTVFAAGNNKTLEKDGEGTWRESKFVNGTPGRENSVAKVSSDFSYLAISEVMPNPFENDDALKPEGEWIEIYNYGPEEIYAGGLVITDKDSENELEIAQANVMNEEDLFIPSGGYVVVYRDGDSDFALNNNGEEEVRLLDPSQPQENQLIDFMSYSDTTEGMSWSNIEGTWYLASPTPNEDNEYTGECVWYIFLDMNNSLYRPDDFSFTVTAGRVAGLVDEITVRGEIEDSNGNIVQTYAPWTNVTVSSERVQRYSPNLPEGIYQAKFWFDNPPCLDLGPDAYQTTRAFAVNPAYRRYDSQLNITSLQLGSDTKVSWGEQFLASLNIYKGNTTNNVVEMWVEKNGQVVSEKTKVTLLENFRTSPLTIPVQLIPNCNQKITDGQATLHLEGLGEKTIQEFTIQDVDAKVCTNYLDYIDQQNKTATRQNKPKVHYLLQDLPASVAPGEALRVPVQLLNDDQQHDYTIWSYLYRGNKCYSCLDSTVSREERQQQVKLQENEANIVDLLLKVDDTIAEGEYKLKVNIRKDHQKTVKELTTSIYVLVSGNSTEKKEAATSLPTASVVDKNQEGPLTSQRTRIPEGVTGLVVYESSSEKAQELTPYILLLSLGILGVVVWRTR